MFSGLRHGRTASRKALLRNVSVWLRRPRGRRKYSDSPSPQAAPQAASIFTSPAPAACSSIGMSRKPPHSRAPNTPSRKKGKPQPRRNARTTASPPNVKTLGRRRSRQSLRQRKNAHGAAAARIIQSYDGKTALRIRIIYAWSRGTRWIPWRRIPGRTASYQVRTSLPYAGRMRLCRPH